MARLLDKKVDGKFPFEYRNASSTDVAATIKRAREKAEAEKRRQDEREAQRNVSQFTRRVR